MIGVNCFKNFLIIFGISVPCGLFAFMVLIGAIKQNNSKPIEEKEVRISLMLQVITFGIALGGLLYLLIDLPTPTVQVASFFVDDSVESLKNNNPNKALAHLTLANEQLSVTGENVTLKVFVENAIEALKNNNTSKALKFLTPSR